MFSLPWTRDTVPHAVIEVTRDCNLACRACYRLKEPGLRTVAAILQDVETIEQHQRVHTISLAGGEPTLHPDLPEIVRRVKARGHRVSLVTNALLLDDALLTQLSAAGLDIAMIHVDEGQTRTDLPDAADVAALNALRERLAARVGAHGITAGLCTTLYPDSLANLPALIAVFLRNPNINFLFATHAVAISDLVAQSAGATAPADAPCSGTSNRQVMETLRQAFGLEPYAYIAPTAPMPDGEWPCITYSVPVAHREPPRFLRMISGRADRALVQASRLIAGRYLYFTPNRALANAVQILANGLGSGHPLRALAFLAGAIDAPLRMKRLVFENAPRITDAGTVNCCDFCPNATVRDGAVVPVCLADHKRELNL